MATGGEQESTCHVMNTDSVGGKMPAMCDPCGRRKKTTPAAVVCSTHDVMLCLECREGHEIYAPGDHQFVATDSVDVSTGNVLVSVNMQGIDRCSAHERKFRYICKDHESLCCDDCHFDNHRTCQNILKLTAMITEEKSYLQGSVVDIQEAMSTATNLIDNCEIQAQESDEHRNNATKEIDRKKEEIVKIFDDAKQRIIKELDEIVNSDKSRLDGVKREAESVLMNLQNLLSLNETVGKNGTDVEKFILDFTCQQKVERLAVLQKNNNASLYTLDWDDHLLALQNETLVSLDVQLPSAIETTVDNDRDDGKALIRRTNSSVLGLSQHKWNCKTM